MMIKENAVLSAVMGSESDTTQIGMWTDFFKIINFRKNPSSEIFGLVDHEYSIIFQIRCICIKI